MARSRKEREGRTRQRTGITVPIAVEYRSRLVRVRPLRRLARMVLEAEGRTKAKVSIALVDDATLARLHKQFLGDERPSDVMSFLLSGPEPLEAEVVISVERAERVGPQHGNTAERETWLYLIHGLLHLCGYDDHRPADRKRMWQRQEELLKQFEKQYHGSGTSKLI